MRFPLVVALSMCFPAPPLDFGKLNAGLLHDYFAPSQVEIAAVAVDGDPISSGDRRARKLRTVGRNVDRHAAASDDAGSPQLARNERGVRGARASGGHDTGRNSKVSDISRAGIGAHKHHRVTSGCQSLRALGIERRASGRDPARRTDS